MKNMKKIIALVLVLMMLFTSCDAVTDMLTDSDSDIIHTEHPDHAEGPNDDQTQSDSPEHTHNYVTSVTNPTCTNEGYTKYTCTDCADTYTSDKVAALGHTVVDIDAIAPTCTEAGLSGGEKCSVCDTVITEQTIIPALGHDEEIAESKAPTCTTVGYTEGRRCMACGTVTLEQTTIPATGHTYKAEVTEPDCTNNGYTTYTCSCGDSYVTDEVAAGDHNYKATITPPTCTKAGYTTYTCSCGDSYVADEVAAGDHNYKATVTPPTCTTAGYTTYTCSCGDSYVADEIEANGHSYNAIITAPTCTANGYTTYTCSCGDTYVTNEVATNGHSAVSVPGKAPTCTENGLSDGKKCSVCQEVLLSQTTILATGHSYSSTVTAPTCTNAGYTTYVCSCGNSYVGNNVPASGHVDASPKNYVCDDCGADLCTNHTEEVIPAKSPTCTSTGLTAGKKCSVCQEILLAQTTIPATGHSYNTVVTAPTCTSVGYTTYTCSCGDVYIGNQVSALSHTEVTIPGNAATCSTAGLTEGKKCSACGTITVAQTTIPTIAHTLVTIPGAAATCTSTGLTDGKKCSVCQTVTVAQTTIPATGHNEVTVTGTAATCTSTGLTDGKKCSVCQTVTITQTTIPATGHNEVSVTGKAATCTSTGLTDGKKCSVCGTVTVAQTVIATTSHTEVTVTGTAATCSTTGLTDGKKCSVCGTVTVAQTTIATTAHTEVTVTGTAATCSTTGLTDGKKCSVCGTVTVAQTTIATIAHTEVDVAGKLATCTATGLTDGKKCSVCGTVTVTQTTIAALGHNWQAATTEAPKTCIACGITEGDKLSSDTSYSKLTVSYINVGQGDSILIQVDDCDILIDAGVANQGTTVSNYLKNNGVDDIELMINTHPDADHCGGLTTVLNNFVVEQVWISKDTSKTTAAYKNFIAAVGTEGLTAKQPSVGTVFTYEHLTLTVLYSTYVSGDSNNSSIVVMLEYGSFKFLFTGDVSQDVENQLVSSGKDLSCDVLKVGHHGSKYSSTTAFLNATGAEYGVICVGSNSYGHPTSDALGRLSSAGVTVYRTDQNGNIVFSTNGATLTLPGGGTDTSGSGSGTSSSGSSSSGSGSSSSGSSSSGTTSSSEYFIGNTETKVFHLPTCANLPATSKQNVMYNYYWIINIAGYTPCGRCLSNYSGGSSSGSGSTTTSYIANSSTKVYHLSTCSYLPDAANRVYITSTSGYTPCSRCIGSSSTTYYILNTDSNVYHLPSCSYLPAASKQEKIYSTSGYTPCGHCIK